MDASSFVYCVYALFEVVLKVLRDTLMQVYALVSHHVVTLARVGKEVGLGTRLDALLDEHEAVLRYHRGVVISSDNLQLALQVLGLGKERCLGITLRVS